MKECVLSKIANSSFNTIEEALDNTLLLENN